MIHYLGNGLGSNNILPKLIKITDYKSEAVKIVIEWIQGYELLLHSCKDFQILADAILFADYYDIQRNSHEIEIT